MKAVTYNIGRADTGALLPYAVVTVLQSDGITKATIFTAGGGALGNPVTADINGAVTFAAANGTYILSAISADGDYSVPAITVQVFDLDALATSIAAVGITSVVTRKYTTKADRDADLTPAANEIALVYADSTALNNDLSYKIGGTGTGSWSGSLGLMAGLASSYAAEASDEADRAHAEAVVSTALTDGFSRKPKLETYTHGITSADGSSGPVSSLIWLNNPVPRSGLVSKVKGWARSTGATEVHFHRQDENGDRVFEGKVTFTVAAASTALDPASQEWDVSAQAFKVQRGWFVGWKSGARVAVATTPTSLYSSTAPTDGTPITPAFINNYPAFSVEIVRDTIVAEGAVKDAIDTIPLMPPAGVHFLSPSNTTRIRAAIAKVRKGIPMSFEESLVLAVGDSNTAGAMVGTNGAYTGSFDRNWFAKLADQLPLLIRDDGLNIPTQRKSSFMGANNPQGAYTLYNPHCVSLGAWAVNGTTGYLSIGGGMFVSTTSGGAVLEFAIADDIDTLEIGYPKGDALSLGVFQYSTNGGSSWTSVDQTGATAYGTVTVTPAAGTGRTIKFKHLSGTNAAVHRMFAHNSAAAALNFVNGAIPGARASSTWTSFANPWGPLSLLRTQAAALKVFMLGSNDQDDGVTLDDYLLWKRREIYAALAKSDVWVFTPPPLQVDGNSNHALARQVSFYAGLYDLCGELNVPFFNMAGDLGTWAQANASGLMGDYIHVNYYGDDRIFYMAFDVFERLG